jgi:hypothetical protein
LPEYQLIEQLLVRRGAFEQGQQQHLDHAEEVSELEEERVTIPSASNAMRRVMVFAVVLIVIALILIVASVAIR